MTSRAVRVIIVLAATVASLAGIAGGGAESVANDSFGSTWARTDQPVAAGQVSRTWMWGPEAFTTALSEPYWDSPGGWRQVQYFDKSRMEISDPNGDAGSIWYVTNGLLARELMTGDIALSDGEITLFASPANVNVAGDGDDPDGPTYATFEALMGAQPYPAGQAISATVDRAGNVGEDAALASMGVTAQQYVAATNHMVASPFWAFMNSSGTVWDGSAYSDGPLFQDPYFATGLPLTEAYWAEVRVAGVQQQVLIQVFERRVLTYTPNNASEWRVEAGNVGRHYYDWRYGELQGLTMAYDSELTGGGIPLKGCADFTDVQSSVNAGELPGLAEYYGHEVAADIVGRICTVQHRNDGVYWHHINAFATIYAGTETGGEPIDQRGFYGFTYFSEPGNTTGDVPRPEDCSVERLYAVAALEDIWAGIAVSENPDLWEYWAISNIDGTVNTAHWETYPCG
jgi:hypothetical protein